MSRARHIGLGVELGAAGRDLTGLIETADDVAVLIGEPVRNRAHLCADDVHSDGGCILTLLSDEHLRDVAPLLGDF